MKLSSAVNRENEIQAPTNSHEIADEQEQDLIILCFLSFSSLLNSLDRSFVVVFHLLTYFNSYSFHSLFHFLSASLSGILRIWCAFWVVKGVCLEIFEVRFGDHSQTMKREK